METFCKETFVAAQGEQSQRLAWHYTVSRNYLKILESGVILPATAGVLPPERPITWFSLNPVWENTVRKGIPVKGGGHVWMGFTEFLKFGVPIYRIGVALETAPLLWRELREQSLMPSAVALHLTRAAKRQYAQPSEWRGTFKEVPSRKWLAVQTYSREARRWESYFSTAASGMAESKFNGGHIADEQPPKLTSSKGGDWSVSPPQDLRVRQSSVISNQPEIIANKL